jgi:hypothetical protein
MARALYRSGECEIYLLDGELAARSNARRN